MECLGLDDLPFRIMPIHMMGYDGIGRHKICYAAQNIQNMIDASSTTLWWVELGLGVLALAAAIWFAAELGRSASGAENTVRLVATSGVFLFSVLGVSVIDQMTENTG